jgi:hypothetical protein
MNLRKMDGPCFCKSNLLVSRKKVWDTLTGDEKDEYTQRAAQISAEKGYVELTPEQCQKKVQACSIAPIKLADSLLYDSCKCYGNA